MGADRFRKLLFIALPLLLCAGTARAADPDKRIQVDLVRTPLRDAVRLVFMNSGLQYSLDPKVPNVPIDLELPLPLSLLLQPQEHVRVIANPADNSLVMLGAKTGIEKVRQVVRYLDVPGRRVSLRVSAGSLAAEGRIKTGSTLCLSDTAHRDRMELRLLPRIGPDKRVEVVLDGVINVGEVARTIATSVSLVPGQAERVLTLGDEPAG